MLDIRAQGCELLTIGQYVQPSARHLPVERYLTPAEFAAWEEEAKRIGFRGVASSPLVRSSYRAESLVASLG